MTNNQLINAEAEKIYYLLSDTAVLPAVTKEYILDGIFGTAMSKTYGTKENAELITDPDSKYYADYRLSYSYILAQRYGIEDWMGLYHLCECIDPSFGVPQDFRLGLNDTVYKVDYSIKDATMRNKELYKPSVEHIVPTSMGGPKSDIRNIMILPLSINKALGNMMPEDRMVMLHGLTSNSFQNRIREAENLFL
jgi:hypothetical protein